MKGIELSERYFTEYGLPMLRAEFPMLLDKAAAGVCGPGSENYGFDDEISRDHDFDPGFYVWLNEADYKEYGFRLARAYDRLPETFMGVKLIGKSAYETARHGVRETGAFFSGLTGFSGVPQTNLQWLSVPSLRLANAVNGKIFYDGGGEVTALREGLSKMPADVKLKKLARATVFAAQAGQYNYARARKHGEDGAAVLSLTEFAKNLCEAVYLLNDRYCPFYKWMFAGARTLPVLGEAVNMTESLLKAPLAAENEALIEQVSAKLIAELKARGLSDHPSDFLEPHAYEIAEKIKDPALRRLHIMD